MQGSGMEGLCCLIALVALGIAIWAVVMTFQNQEKIQSYRCRCGPRHDGVMMQQQQPMDASHEYEEPKGPGKYRRYHYASRA